MEEVFVDLGERSYSILIGQDLLVKLGHCLSNFGLSKRVMLVTNKTVNQIYGEKVKLKLYEDGYFPVLAEIPDGEEYKTLAMAEKLYNIAFEGLLDRRSPVIALGGGVVGDLAGFVAATYLRGIPFIQVPTTLLAQVDSSVGGKVAVNHTQGKNMIGAFYQPKVVLTDLDTLKTLPRREIQAGLAEVVKYGVIAEATFFNWLEENLNKILALEPMALAYLVATSCQIKAHIVQEDETEQGRRAILNFGHTVGHAIEAVTGYTIYNHGEAVAMGMVAEGLLALKMGLWSVSEQRRLKNLLAAIGLPVRLANDEICQFVPTMPCGLDKARALNLTPLLAAMTHDKKVYDQQLTFILPRQLGQVGIYRDVSPDLILAALAELISDE